MNLYDIIIGGILAAAVISAVARTIKHAKNGCSCGNCSECAMGCDKRKKSDDNA